MQAIFLKIGARGQPQGEILISSFCFRSSEVCTSKQARVAWRSWATASYFKFRISVPLKLMSLSSTMTTAHNRSSLKLSRLTGMTVTPRAHTQACDLHTNENLSFSYILMCKCKFKCHFLYSVSCFLRCIHTPKAYKAVDRALFTWKIPLMTRGLCFMSTSCPSQLSCLCVNRWDMC